MIKINSPDELERFIKMYSGEDIRKMIISNEDSIAIRLYVLKTESYEVGEYRVKIGGPSIHSVAVNLRKLYDRLNLPTIDMWGMSKLNAKFSSK